MDKNKDKNIDGKQEQPHEEHGVSPDTDDVQKRGNKHLKQRSVVVEEIAVRNHPLQQTPDHVQVLGLVIVDAIRVGVDQAQREGEPKENPRHPADIAQREEEIPEASWPRHHGRCSLLSKIALAKNRPGMWQNDIDRRFKPPYPQRRVSLWYRLQVYSVNSFIVFHEHNSLPWFRWSYPGYVDRLGLGISRESLNLFS
jgi:hypothetical protein